jgi:hypothetical protein
MISCIALLHSVILGFFIVFLIELNFSDQWQNSLKNNKKIAQKEPTPKCPDSAQKKPFERPAKRQKSRDSNGTANALFPFGFAA